MSARAAAALLDGSEAELAERWAAPAATPLRLDDGRPVRVIFPGVPGGGAGPDFRGAIVEVAGDVLRGDVEVHLRASGWQAHGHQRDPAYAGVVLHVVAANDSGAAITLQRGRAVPILVLPPAQPGFPPPFTPPCTFARSRGLRPEAVLARVGVRRLRAKAVRWQSLAAGAGPGAAFYAAALETIGGPANREAFASVARSLPLAALLERAGQSGAPRALAMTAELKGVARLFPLRRAGLRPLASPGRRLEAAAGLLARLFPGAEPDWPFAADEPILPRLRTPGIGRQMAIEIAVNAVLPVALAGRTWPEETVLAAWAELPGPGTYGRLRRLEGWLGEKPFGSAAALQGGLLLHGDYCTAGRCGRCPLTP
jgi:hypothetical protein